MLFCFFFLSNELISIFCKCKKLLMLCYTLYLLTYNFYFIPSSVCFVFIPAFCFTLCFVRPLQQSNFPYRINKISFWGCFLFSYSLSSPCPLECVGQTNHSTYIITKQINLFLIVLSYEPELPSELPRIDKRNTLLLIQKSIYYINSLVLKTSSVSY